MSEIVRADHAPLPAAQAQEKRDKGVMVYLTDAERTAFKRWAFEHGVSMSDVLATKVLEILDDTQYDPRLAGNETTPPGDQAAFTLEASDDVALSSTSGDHETASALAVDDRDALIALASQRYRIDTELEARIWAALADGARFPYLVALIGLPQEQIRHILKQSR